ncbi:MAG: sensor histidine kinase KdpD [Anaerolineae bacterium]|nr:sensor histidine kinase KdpD [Anaerolineae bacterium]
MNESYQRPDPDELLKKIKSEESGRQHGRMKIFLGYVAGVGKTYAMLEAAHQRKAEGLDVLVGYVETHGRRETTALLDGLELAPRLNVDYRGTNIPEMDLDVILSRRPQLVLVDELAHTNAPGSRHNKRYQDVQEILNNGIDVYTTLNVQHLESLNDVVFQITGVRVRETVPDGIVDQAYEIELIDLPADELIRRLQDGKVYVPDQANRALQRFFRKGNLTALRELALRRAADRVDSQMLSYMETKSIPGPWPAGERILVCISSHPMGERLIRAGRRLADDLNADWYVIFVETPGHLQMSLQNRERVFKNLKLAEQLGANLVNVSAESVSKAVIDFSRQHNITKIIAGKPLRPRWFELIRGSVIDQIIRNSANIDVYVINEGVEEPLQQTAREWHPHRPWDRYFFSFFLVVLGTLLCVPLSVYLAPVNLVMIFLTVVVLSAIFLGRGPAILSSFTSVLAFDFFFIDPRLTFSVYDTQYIITFIGLLVVGVIISNSAAMLRNQVDVLKKREHHARTLNMLSRELTGASSLEQVLDVVVRNVGQMFNRQVVVLLSNGKTLAVSASTQGFTMKAEELAVAEWAYKNGQPAGRGTNTLSAADIRYIPLITAGGTVGILGLRPLDTHDSLSLDQSSIIESFANLAALAIERANLGEKAAQSEMLRNTEKLQTALLNSISHELRTPLATVTGVLTSLRDSESAKKTEEQLDQHTRIELIESATQQAMQLNNLVENLLDMTRLEAGAIHLNREFGDLQDLIGSVLHKLSLRTLKRQINVDIPADFPLIPMDVVLIAQVLTNLVDNACKYSDPGSPVEVYARSDGEWAHLSVKNYGPEIPLENLERIFDKFYQVPRSQRISGTGLGLSICKGIVETHGGYIRAENIPVSASNPQTGVVITFSLPLKL